MDREAAIETLVDLFGFQEKYFLPVLNALGLNAFSDKALVLMAEKQIADESKLKNRRKR